MSRPATAVLLVTATLTLGGCGGPGLPPAGPAPGEVEVGYGTRQKGETTGAMNSVSETEIAAAKPLKIEEFLRGRVPGLQVLRGRDGSVTFRIRGVNSLQSDQPPLFVVDGIPVSANGIQSALDALSPQDIRQVDVLKDVASTSVYGMRGAGGVIIITTRR